MGAFCCHGNQTKMQIGKLLAILNCPYQSNIPTELETNRFSSGEQIKVEIGLV